MAKHKTIEIARPLQNLTNVFIPATSLAFQRSLKARYELFMYSIARKKKTIAYILCLFVLQRVLPLVIIIIINSVVGVIVVIIVHATVYVSPHQLQARSSLPSRLGSKSISPPVFLVLIV